ncbi:MAG: TetR/AcrR family transcriptional regulator [Planctomycetota bacterium]
MPDTQRGRPREFDPDAALDAAMSLFWEKGYDATSVGELCDAMGIARQSMYDWVGDKKALYLKTLERYCTTRICGLRDMLAMPGSPLGNLWHCLHAMAEFAKQPESIGCFLTNAQSEFGVSDPDVLAHTQQVETFITEAFQDVLDRAKDVGEISASADTAALASAIAVLRNGLMVAGRSGQSKESIDQTIRLIEGMLKAE